MPGDLNVPMSYIPRFSAHPGRILPKKELSRKPVRDSIGE